jgi:hypothetical protein
MVKKGQIRILRIWDFDNVIFNSGVHLRLDYVIDNMDNELLIAKLPDTSKDILVTGRSQIEDSEVIEQVLNKYRIKFDSIVYSGFRTIDYIDPTYYIRYINWKVGVIQQYANIRSVVAIDDDKNIIKKLDKLNIMNIRIKKFMSDLTNINILIEQKYKIGVLI